MSADLTVYGYAGIVLGVLGAVSWAGIFLERSQLRKRLESKDFALKLWQARDKMLRETARTLRAELDDKNADLIECQTRLQRYARKQGVDGKFTGRA